VAYRGKLSQVELMGVGSGGQWLPSWIFIDGTNIIDRGLKVLFFGLFFRCPHPGRGLIVLFFGLFSVVFSVFPPPGNFSVPMPLVGLHYQCSKTSIRN